jgi:SAM-dependent methyltransferase
LIASPGVKIPGARGPDAPALAKRRHRCATRTGSVRSSRRLASTLALGRWHDPPVTPGEQWLAATWPFVRSHLPDAPGRVLELGCGHLGGHVPSLRARGYDAIGIDPEAPEGPHYQRTTFESAELPEQVEAVVTSTSLHHVGDAADVIDRIAATLRRGGTLVVVEWGGSDLTRKPLSGVSSACKQTPRKAGYIAAETNGSRPRTTGRPTSRGGRNKSISTAATPCFACSTNALRAGC